MRLKRTRNPDVVVIEHLERFLRDAERRGVTPFLAGVRPEFLRILENVNLKAWFPADQIFPEEDETFSATLHAVRRAHQLAGEHAARTSTDHEFAGDGPDQKRDPAYYLV